MTTALPRLARNGGHAHVGDIRGRGLFRAIEFVEDRAAKRPSNPDHQVHERVKWQPLRRGLGIYPAGGTVDGIRGDHVLVAPPYIATPADTEEIVDRLGEAVDAALTGP